MLTNEELRFARIVDGAFVTRYWRAAMEWAYNQADLTSCRFMVYKVGDFWTCSHVGVRTTFTL